jgi:hypothetical protein
MAKSHPFPVFGSKVTLGYSRHSLFPAPSVVAFMLQESQLQTRPNGLQSLKYYSAFYRKSLPTTGLKQK